MDQEMTPEEAKASLGIATFLQDQMMPKAPVDQEMTPGQEQTSLRDQYQSPPEQEQDSKSAELEGIKNEISVLKEEIREVLEGENTQTDKKEPKEEDNFKDEVRGLIDSKLDNLTQTIKDALKDD